MACHAFQIMATGTSAMFQGFFPKCTVPENVHTPPTQKVLEFPGSGGSLRRKHLKNVSSLRWGPGSLEKSPPLGSTDIFWNYTDDLQVSLVSNSCFIHTAVFGVGQISLSQVPHYLGPLLF